jgi:hypothetical protein
LTTENRERILRDVIPTVLLVGFLFGRRWKVAVPVAVVGWPTLLIADGVDRGLGFALGAGLLAAANVVVGVLTYQAIRLIARRAAAVATHAGKNS